MQLYTDVNYTNIQPSRKHAAIHSQFYCFPFIHILYSANILVMLAIPHIVQRTVSLCDKYMQYTVNMCVCDK